MDAQYPIYRYESINGNSYVVFLGDIYRWDANRMEGIKMTPVSYKAHESKDESTAGLSDLFQSDYATLGKYFNAEQLSGFMAGDLELDLKPVKGKLTNEVSGRIKNATAFLNAFTDVQTKMLGSALETKVSMDGKAAATSRPASGTVKSFEDDDGLVDDIDESSDEDEDEPERDSASSTNPLGFPLGSDARPVLSDSEAKKILKLHRKTIQAAIVAMEYSGVDLKKTASAVSSLDKPEKLVVAIACMRNGNSKRLISGTRGSAQLTIIVNKLRLGTSKDDATLPRIQRYMAPLTARLAALDSDESIDLKLDDLDGMLPRKYRWLTSSGAATYIDKNSAEEDMMMSFAVVACRSLDYAGRNRYTANLRRSWSFFQLSLGENVSGVDSISVKGFFEAMRAKGHENPTSFVQAYCYRRGYKHNVLRPEGGPDFFRYARQLVKRGDISLMTEPDEAEELFKVPKAISAGKIKAIKAAAKEKVDVKFSITEATKLIFDI